MDQPTKSTPEGDDNVHHSKEHNLTQKDLELL